MNPFIKRMFFTIFVILLSYSNSLFAQKSKFKKATKLYENLSYIKASEMYLKLAEDGYQPVELLQNLGNSFYFNAEYTNAVKWYDKLFAKTKDLAPIYYLRYAQALKVSNKHELAAQYFDAYVAKNKNSKQKIENAAAYQKIIEENTGRYQLKALAFNSKGIDYGSAITNNKLIYASTNNNVKQAQEKSSWDGYSFLNLYQISINEDGSYGEPMPLFGKGENTKYHESSAVFTKDGKTMYFTRNMVKKGKNKKGNVIRLKIYRAHLVNENWTDIEDLSINSNLYSTAHPALNTDENMLFFVSNMKGSLGETDIFKVAINADESLGTPQNLGEYVNTRGRESFPFITSKNELYFSSDGHFGLGGYDVYYTNLNNLETSELKNIGTPINSSFDDFAFAINNGKGYISSNRLNGQGEDDIYSFEELLCQQSIEGVVRDDKTGELLSEVSVTLYDDNGIKVEEMSTDTLGTFNFKVACEKKYNVIGIKERYNDAIAEITTTNEWKLKNLVTLTLGKPEIVLVGNDLMINIDPVYFDYGKYSIRKDAEIQLNKVVAVLNKYPELIIETGSHTDSRSSDRYNLKLSKQRASAIMEWIVSKGISPDRILYKGYGETKLRNKCSNGVKCSEKEHELNRRSEFVIINPKNKKK
jgi:outer membrane protein OmpA-like peptidoglycan-associated protein